MKQFDPNRKIPHNCKIISSFCVWLILATPPLLAADRYRYEDVQQSEPDKVSRSPASEYYTTSASAKVVIPINIWGEISKPGVHYVPVGANLTKTVSGAGGPMSTASMPKIKLIRGNTTRYIDLLEDGNRFEIQSYDTVIVEKSWKTELPLIFSAIGTIISLSTFIIVMQSRK